MSTSAPMDLDKLGQASRRSAIVSGIGLFIILASLGFGIYELHTLQGQISTIQAQKAELTTELDQTKAELEQTKAELEQNKSDLNEVRKKLGKGLSALGFSPDRVTFLMDHVLPNSESGGVGGVSFTDEIEQANKELEYIKNEKPDFPRRGSVTVRYYPKRADHDRGAQAIKYLQEERKFKTVTMKKVGDPDTPTNAIWLMSPNLSTQDIKLVAYALIRKGIQIRYIGGDYPNPEKIKELIGTMMIMVGGEPNYRSMQVWTVERIRNATRFK